LVAPISWFPRLAQAGIEELRNYEIIGGGVGIHWPGLDEDIEVIGLIEGRRAVESPGAMELWRTTQYFKMAERLNNPESTGARWLRTIIRFVRGEHR